MHAVFGIDLLDNGSRIHFLINQQGDIFDVHPQVGDFAQEVFQVIIEAGDGHAAGETLVIKRNPLARTR